VDRATLGDYNRDTIEMRDGDSLAFGVGSETVATPVKIIEYSDYL